VRRSTTPYNVPRLHRGFTTGIVQTDCANPVNTGPEYQVLLDITDITGDFAKYNYFTQQTISSNSIYIYINPIFVVPPPPCFDFIVGMCACERCLLMSPRRTKLLGSCTYTLTKSLLGPELAFVCIFPIGVLQNVAWKAFQAKWAQIIHSRTPVLEKKKLVVAKLAINTCS
jgi:hypothetical protein